MVIAWEIWKTHCAYIFSHTPVLPDKTIQHVQATTRDFISCLYIQNLPKQRTGFTGTAHTLTLICCYVDGYFQEPSSGGTGYIITKVGELIQFAGEGCTWATSVFHVECLSLLRVVQAVLTRGIEQCTFLTDSRTLVHSLLQPRAPIRVQLQEYAKMHIWSFLSQYPGLACQYVQREANQQAHLFSNWARISQCTTLGYTYPLFAPL